MTQKLLHICIVPLLNMAFSKLNKNLGKEAKGTKKNQLLWKQTEKFKIDKNYKHVKFDQQNTTRL